MRLLLFLPAGYPDSHFDIALCGAIPPSSFVHGEELLEELVRILKPSGSLVLKEPVTNNGEVTISSATLQFRSYRKLIN